MSLSIYEPTAEKIVHNTSADFILRYIGEVIHVVQYDDSLPILAVALYRNGKPYTVSAEEVNIRYGKPDGTFVYNPALGRDKAGNVVYFEVTQQMTSAPGKARLAVEVVDGGTACSGIVMMEVERNPVQEDAIESTDEFQTVGQQIEEKVQAVRAEMSDILATKQDYFVATIDLSGSQYDQDTWYPVTGTYIPKSGLHKIHVYSNFDVGAHPSWATNSAGYTCNMEIYDKAQAWGQADGAAICLDYSWKHTNQRPCGYVQMTHSSTPVLILRGGGIYKVITDYESEWKVRTEAYTLSGDTVRPAAQSRFDFNRATVFADIDGDVTGNLISTAETASKLETARYIDGVQFDGSEDICHYGVCDTATTAAEKTIDVPGFLLVQGARVTVLFNNGNTATYPTLKVGNTAALPIYYRGSIVPVYYIQAGSVLSLVYSGSYWMVEGDLTGYLVDGKAPKSHASAATTYGVASSSYYGHAKASTTTPKAPGTAAVGTETAAFARGDHVHPLPITDVTDSFTWTGCKNYKAYKIGNVVFFRAEVTTKTTDTITVATAASTALKPSALTPLMVQFNAGADILKRGICWAYTDGTVKLTTLAGWTSANAVAAEGSALISGQWFVG